MQGLVPFKAHKKGYAKLQKEFERTELMRDGAISAEVLARPLSVTRSPLPRAPRPRFLRSRGGPENEDMWPTPVPVGLCTAQHYEVQPDDLDLYTRALEASRISVQGTPACKPMKGKGKGAAAAPPQPAAAPAAAAAAAAVEEESAAGPAFAAADDDGAVAAVDVIRPARIELADFVMDAWYSSPFPEDFQDLPCTYVCQYTLRFMKSKAEVQHHVENFRGNGHRPCPPGEEVYRDGNLSVWEVDGRRHRVYCQNL